jgi:hypothetical protein
VAPEAIALLAVALFGLGLAVFHYFLGWDLKP